MIIGAVGLVAFGLVCGFLLGVKARGLVPFRSPSNAVRLENAKTDTDLLRLTREQVGINREIEQERIQTDHDIAAPRRARGRRDRGDARARGRASAHDPSGGRLRRRGQDAPPRAEHVAGPAGQGERPDREAAVGYRGGNRGDGRGVPDARSPARPRVRARVAPPARRRPGVGTR